jgi:hypothetical protein
VEDVNVSRASTIIELRPEQATRALYIDFEGQIERPPVLLGCARRSGPDQIPRMWQAVTDRLFEPLAREDGAECLDLSDAVERILQRAEKRDRLIVAWTEHELNVVRTHCPEHLARFESRYVNARLLAVRWRNKRHGGKKPDANTLAAYLGLIGHTVPPGAGVGRTGETIGVLRRSLERDPTGARVTDIQRRRWRDLREHNRHDCAGMRKVCLLATRDIPDSRNSVSGRSPESPGIQI